MSMVDQDLMHQEAIHEVVKEAYEALGTGAGPVLVSRLYPEAEAAELPPGAVAWALGVGNPVGEAGLRAGETVLDVGCGGGIDSILAARRVGPQGRVIGIDILDEMLERARANAAAAGVAERCQFLPGQMESIPMPDQSVDVTISNGVINLSPRKSRVLAELYRVLRPGGRFTMSDLILEEELPPELTTSDAAWAG